ncbi:MAG: ribokinase [Thermoprotei archaeon]|nr:MAG: ribokinase [Thermoprotei archaeon]RLF23500.1 MAG: ribokinase [Thermoprotei archaeon]
MKRPIAIVVGTMHMDFTVYVERLPLHGETVIGYSFEMSPGGKGANQAVTLARLGAEVYLISRVGKDYVGKLLLENARRNNVNVDYVVEDEASHSGVALIMVDKKGENLIAVAPGVDSRVSIGDVERAEDLFSRADVVLAQLEIPVETSMRAIELGKEHGITTILNPAPAREVPIHALKHVDVITPNIRELEMLSKIKVEKDEDVVKAGRRLLELGVGRVIVTMGARGAMIVDDKGPRMIPTYKVEVVDTVGAGDAFNGALAFALALGVDIDEAVKFANLVAAIKVTRKGAQTGLPKAIDVVKFTKERGLELKVVNILAHLLGADVS